MSISRSRMYRRPASASQGLPLASNTTLTGSHISRYGLPGDLDDPQFFTSFMNANSAANAFGATNLGGDDASYGTSAKQADVAATLALAQLDAQKKLAPASILGKKSQMSRSGASDSLNRTGGKDTVVPGTTSQIAAFAPPKGLSHFSRLHPVFGTSGWVLLDDVTSYLWRESPDPATIAREASIYNHVVKSGVDTSCLVRVLGNDRRYVSRTNAYGGSANLGTLTEHSFESLPHTSSGLTESVVSPLKHDPAAIARCYQSQNLTVSVTGEIVPTMFRAMHFVVMEPYKCTLQQALELSAKVGATSQPTLSATAVLKFVRDCLRQIQQLHLAAVTHNRIHAELVCIASPNENQDFDTFGQFERHSRLSAHRHQSRNKSNNSFGKTGDRSSAGDSGSIASSKISSAYNAGRIVSDGSSVGSDEEELFSPQQASLLPDKKVAPPLSPFVVGNEAPTSKELKGFFEELNHCVGKLSDLSAATVVNQELIKPLLPFTLSAQRRDPSKSSFRISPILSLTTSDFVSPPEWTVSADDNEFVVCGGRGAVRYVRRSRSQSAVSDMGCPQEKQHATPTVSSDVFLFGQLVKKVFSEIVDGVSALLPTPQTEDEDLPPRMYSVTDADLPFPSESAISASRELVRQGNKKMCDLDQIGHLECHHFVELTTQADPALRLTVAQCLAHPFFWPPAASSSFITVLAEFLSVPRIQSNVDSLTSAATAQKRQAAKRAEQASRRLKSPADVANCSKELLRWCSVIITATSLDGDNLVATRKNYNPGNLLSTPIGEETTVTWMPPVRDWFDALGRSNVSGVRYDYDNTVRDQMEFFTVLHSHVKKYADTNICGGNEDVFTTKFIHERFPGVLSTWLQRLTRHPSDAEKFLEFAQPRKMVLPQFALIETWLMRMIADKKRLIAERLKAQEIARRRAIDAPFKRK